MNRAKNSRNRTYRKYLIGLVVIAAVAFGAHAFISANAKTDQSRAATTPKLRNDVRRENLKLISGALNRYMAEVGPLPVAVPAVQTPICSGSSVNCKKAVRFDLMFLANAGYLTSVPNDPVGGHDMWSTGYTAGRNADGKLELQAPRAEAGAKIYQIVQ